MSLVTPQYVQGKYTVAQRDAILDKANSYPGGAAGLANQVPTLFPDGTIQWKQVPSGESGTANANIAVVEASQASKDYAVGDLLVYNGQLYKVTAAIETDDAITPGTNVTPATVESWTDERAAAVAGNLATVEASSTASKAYAAGEYLVYHYQLYKASTAISQGDTLEVGTNLDLAIYSEDVAAALDERTPLVGKGINLLDNWYFPAAINQRGQNSYYIASGELKAFDRWIISQSTTTLVANDCVTIAQLGANPQMFQAIEAARIETGQTYTISFLVKTAQAANNNWILFYNDANGQHNKAFGNSSSKQLVSVTFTAPGGNSGYYYFGVVGGSVGATSEISLIAAKLELGSQQTLARNIGTEANPAWVLNDPPPNYQQELAKCQRYLTVLKGNTPYNIFGGGLGDGNTVFWPTFQLPVTMRSVTKVEYSGTIVVADVGDISRSNNSVTKMAIESTQTGAVAINVTATTALTAGQWYNVGSKNSIDAKIIISAEL